MKEHGVCNSVAGSLILPISTITINLTTVKKGATMFTEEIDVWFRSQGLTTESKIKNYIIKLQSDINYANIKIMNLVGRGKTMSDITSEGVEVSIREDGKVLWVNTEEGCVLRISNIKDLIIEDASKKLAIKRARDVLKGKKAEKNKGLREALEKKQAHVDTLAAERDRLREELESTAKNTCCDKCQEEARGCSK